MKKILALILALFCVFSSSGISVFAIESLDGPQFDINTSDVLEDLSRTYIDGFQFDPDAYPLTPEADYVWLLNMIEYGWDNYSQYTDVVPYRIYFYIYNPSGDKLLPRGENYVQMSVSEQDLYVKYLLSVASTSEDNRFVKLKLSLPGTVYKRLSSDSRTYKISGIELETKEKGLKDYKIAGTYTFTGKQSEKTLECKTDILTTLDLELGDTCYRTKTSEIGEYHRNQLDSVYFSIPNFILDRYGYEIYKIRFEMTKKLITGIVTSDKEAYDAVEMIIKNGISPSSYDDFKNSYSEKLGWSFGTNEVNGLFDWIKPYTWNSPGETRLDYLSFFTYVTTYDPNDFTSIDGEELLRYWKEYPLKDESCLDIVPKQTYERNFKQSFTSADYQSNHNFWDTMLDYGLWEAIYGEEVDPTLFKDVKPFQEIILSDLNTMTKDSVASTYFVQKDDVDTIRSYVANAEARDETTFLFHFNKQDFFAMPGGMQKERVSGLESVDVDSFFFKEYIYEDFDILEISLRDEQGIITVLPTVMDPTTIVPDIDSPIFDPLGVGDNDDSWKRIVAIIAVVLLVVFVIWLISKFIPKKVKVVSSGRRRRRR